MSKNHLICLVDDDQSIQRMLSRAVATAGFDVASFGSAEEFLTSGLLDDCACLILDVDLPGMSGIELQQHLNDLALGVPIIIISGEATKATKERVMKAGAVAFFNKPFDINSLLDSVGSVESLPVS